MQQKIVGSERGHYLEVNEDAPFCTSNNLFSLKTKCHLI